MLNALRRTAFFTVSNCTKFFPHKPLSAHFTSVKYHHASPAITFIQSIFSTLDETKFDKRMKINLVEEIITYECKKAETRLNQPSGIFQLIRSIPSDLTIDERVNWFSGRLNEFPAMPVMTSHPTRVFSNQALFMIYDTTQLAMSLNQPDLCTNTSQNIKDKMSVNINYLVHHSLLPEKNLTPKEEADMGLFIYKKILETFPDYFNGIVDEFINVHGGEREVVSNALKPAIMLSYLNIYSWIKGDSDGNDKVTAGTMSQTVPAQQISIIELYLEQIGSIISLMDASTHKPHLSRLQKMHGFLQRCIDAIHFGIWFDVTGSNETKQRVMHSLNVVISLLDDEPSLLKQLNSLKDLIELAGFFGGLKEFVRQTTKVNTSVFENLTSILVANHTNIRELLQKNTDYVRAYHELDPTEKTILHNHLNSDPDYFSLLKKHSHEFTRETVTELARLLFILKHNDIFPSYIGSDTEDKINFNELLILMRFASFMDGSLRIGHMKSYPVNLLPLCESPKDLANFKNILKAMLDDTYLRQKIVASGFLSYVSGPSDLGKTGGIAVYISLVRSQMEAQDILNEYKLIYPELQPVVLRILHGFGSDMKRRFGSARQQAHCTHQGWGAYDVLCAPGSFLAFLHGVVGFPSENDFKAQELRLLKSSHPDVFDTLLAIEQQAVTSFQLFIEQACSGELLKALTHPVIAAKCNISSRAGSKSSLTDVTKSRAIGLVNLYLLTGVNWDIFMSIEGLTHHLSNHQKHNLPILFNNLTVIKDVVYKLFFSIAVSDIPRAWTKI